jgi:hypothetical protein
MAQTPVVTLLTDFGMQDHYVAAMKGVLLSRRSDVRIVDVCHQMPAHGVQAAAFVLAQSIRWFPEGTIHVVVVDPGVGTERDILAVRLRGQRLIVPDNGVLSIACRHRRIDAMASVTNPDVVDRGAASSTFHGRDIFAPAAAALAGGMSVEQLGQPRREIHTLDIPDPQVSASGIEGEVIYVDRFGNLVTNIPAEMVRSTFPAPSSVSVRVKGSPAGHLQEAYGRVGRGELLGILDSSDLFEVAVNQGRASERLEATVGATVELVADDT